MTENKKYEEYPEFIRPSLFRNALIKNVAMNTYDPAMNPEDLIYATLKAKRLVDELFDLMTDIPNSVEDYDAITKHITKLIKDIAKTMEGE